MARPPDTFNRSKSRYIPQPKVLVICEDSKSGLNYLKDARGYFRANIEVEISHCGKTDPKGIVREAIKRQTNFDQVYCVIDRDNHHNFEEAVQLANTRSKVSVIVSFPCFEFWLLLHFGYCRKPYTSMGANSSADLLIRDLQKHPGMETYSKGDDQNIFESLLGEKFNTARSIAPRILNEAKADGNFNPSTQIHILLDNFEKLSKLQPVT